MRKPFRSAARCYCLILRHRESETVSVGSLGSIDWDAGWMYYVGRARYGWGSRLKRFRGTGGTLHWHIDHLVASRLSELAAVLVHDLAAEAECLISQRIGGIENVEPITRGFGASDCDAGCEAHGWVGPHDPRTLQDRLHGTNEAPAGRVRFEPDRSRWIPASGP